MNLKDAPKAQEHENKDPHPTGKEQFDALMTRGIAPPSL